MADYLELSQFDATLDAAETDPRPRWKAGAAAIVEQELGPRSGIPEGIAADLRRGALPGLAARLVGALRSGHHAAGETAIADFQTQLRNTVRSEREHGRLRCISEIERCRVELVAHKWNGAAEHSALLAMIKPGEKIRSIGFWKITLEFGRVITRDEVRSFEKPLTWTNPTSWESQFISDREIADAEEAAARQATPYAPGSDSRNWDLPKGVRQ